MSSIVATLTATPGAENKLEQILRDLVAATAKESGAVVYDIVRDDERPGVFVACERYRDANARSAHLASPHLARALELAGPYLAAEPSVRFMTPVATIRHELREHEGRQVQTSVLPLGPVNLVYAQTAKGVLACGAIDPAALERFGVAAARVKPTGASVSNFDDLLAGTVREANAPARALGLREGMSGGEALRCL